MPLNARLKRSAWNASAKPLMPALKFPAVTLPATEAAGSMYRQRSKVYQPANSKPATVTINHGRRARSKRRIKSRTSTMIAAAAKVRIGAIS